jgi:hypothetical protein
VQIGEAAKAVGTALALLVLNLLLTTLAVFAYAQWIAPGQPAESYDAAALDIAAWTAPVGGALLFFGACFWLAGRRRGRSRFGFVLRLWIAYAILDVLVGAALAGVPSLLSWELLGSLAVALLAGLAGAVVASRSNLSGEQTA